MDRGRLALEWRAAVAVAAVAVAGTVLGVVRPVDSWWLLGGFVVIVVIALAALVLAVRRPVGPAPPMPRRYGDDEVTAARRRVRRGEPVAPAELQVAMIAQVRRGLRAGPLSFGGNTLLGATMALRLGEGGFLGGMAYAGIVLMLIGVGGLAWSGVVQRRLDRLEDVPGPTGPAAA